MWRGGWWAGILGGGAKVAKLGGLGAGGENGGGDMVAETGERGCGMGVAAKAAEGAAGEAEEAKVVKWWRKAGGGFEALGVGGREGGLEVDEEGSGGGEKVGGGGLGGGEGGGGDGGLGGIGGSGGGGALVTTNQPGAIPAGSQPSKYTWHALLSQRFIGRAWHRPTLKCQRDKSAPPETA
ncbi:hypothetical protein CYMTET_15725 [Cymbomonas tetramitiformis]|uniref:Uncharacterized protein n=1 Tax=Cymbomonas tetramitiformis TaxID=36881 RepID=A0AAE0GDF2_9CHLO|nr:hypothetical protein CYMTET_15725 [Cymbomonas tetramitiformis]